MKNLKNMLVLAALAILAACGGGSSDTQTAPSQTVGTGPVPTPTVPTPIAVTNPLTGAPAPGNPTKTLMGFTSAGATVTAYAVNPDGTSGAALGAPVVSASSGEFTIALNDAPHGMVRLVAVGGTTFRSADSTTQPSGTLQLVTPFVTTAYNNFKISPLTDIAASVMASRASKGDSLTSAFGAGMKSVLQLDVVNVPIMQDSTVWLNMLKGSIKSEVTFFPQQSPEAQEITTALEYLGVLLDMPAKDVARVMGAVAQSDYSQAVIDGKGAPVMAGAWVNGAFDSSASVTLKSLLDAKVPDSVKTVDSKGVKTAPALNNYVSRYLILDFALDRACYNQNTIYLTERYPFYQLDSKGQIPAADCTAAMQRIADLRARVASNNSTKMK